MPASNARHWESTFYGKDPYQVEVAEYITLNTKPPAQDIHQNLLCVERFH